MILKESRDLIRRVLSKPERLIANIRQAGIHPNPNGGARATARRSTGINAKAHEPIDPRMPNLPPS